MPLGALALACLVWACDAHVRRSAAPHLFNEPDALPMNEVGLVLGTSHRLRSGAPNPYFRHRMEAAVRLYRSGRVRYLLVSGDHGTPSYNEPRRMQEALIAGGVDSARIVLDHAGFRTLDSVVRARDVFGQQRLTIISQRFHNERAVIIARGMGIDAVGFNAQDAEGGLDLRTWLRERLARVKLVFDQAVGTGPRYLGDPVPIGPPSAAQMPNSIWNMAVQEFPGAERSIRPSCHL